MYDDNANNKAAREQRLRWALLLRSWGHIPIPLHQWLPEASVGFWEHLKRKHGKPALTKADADEERRKMAKKPLSDAWQNFSMPSEAMLRQWILNEGSNYGIVCGSRSGNLVVIDFDNRAVFDEWKLISSIHLETLTVESARGVHVYLCVDELPAHKMKMAQGGGDILTTGTYVVAPYSLHPSGVPYRVRMPEHAIRRVESLDELKLPIARKPAPTTYVPRGGVALPSSPRMARIAGVVTAFSAAVEGTRNSMLLWSACRCFDEGMSAADVIDTLMPVALSLGLSEHETLSTIASAERQERRLSSYAPSSAMKRRLSPIERQQQRRRR